jgi:hypothetical protein
MIRHTNGSTILCDKKIQCSNETVKAGQCNCAKYHPEHFMNKPTPPPSQLIREGKDPVPLQNTPEYRIVEHAGKFTIQVKTIRETGMWWWKKTLEVWVSSDINGKPCFYASCGAVVIDTWKIKQPSFDTLEKAREKALSWKQCKVIHYI